MNSPSLPKKQIIVHPECVSEEQDDQMLISMEASEDSTQFAIIFEKKTAISVSELILALEEYLTDLTRAEADKRRPGTEVH